MAIGKRQYEAPYGWMLRRFNCFVSLTTHGCGHKGLNSCALAHMSWFIESRTWLCGL